MGNEGYIKLYRRMMKWGWYTDTPTKCVFLHLLFLACYEPCYFRGVQLEAGQTVASIRQIATDTGLSVKQVRTAIEHLKQTQEVAQKSCGKFSVYTVNNYTDYQCIGTETGTNEGTARAQQGHSKGTHPNIKKNKEDKEVYMSTQDAPEDEPTSMFDQFWHAYPKKTGKLKARESFAKNVKDAATLKSLLDSLAYLKTTEGWKKENGSFIPMPTTFLNQHRWEDETAQPPKPKPEPKKRVPIFDREYTREDMLNGAVPIVVGWKEVDD